MIVFLIPILAIIIAMLVYSSKKSYLIEKKICFSVLVLNVFLILCLGISSFANISILFWVNILINVIFILLLKNPKIVLSKKTVVIFLVIYLFLMFIIPVYKVDGHDHVFIDVVNNNINEDNKDNEESENITSSYLVDDMMSEAEKIINKRSEGKIEKIVEYTDYFNCYLFKIIRINQNE